MSTENNIQMNELLTKANGFKQYFDIFNNKIDKRIRRYLSFLFKVSLCIYHEVEGTEELEDIQIEFANEFQLLCQRFSKYKLLNKIVFAPCKNNEGNSDEKFEFLVSYDESEFSTNVENLEKCVELYINSKKPVKLSEVETHYMYSEDFKVLDSNISEVVENIHNGEVDVEVIKSKIEEVEKIVEEHQLFIILLDLQNSPDKKIENAYK